MLLYQKEGYSLEIENGFAWKQKKKGGILLRRPLIVSCLNSEFRGFLIPPGILVSTVPLCNQPRAEVTKRNAWSFS